MLSNANFTFAIQNPAARVFRVQHIFLVYTLLSSIVDYKRLLIKYNSPGRYSAVGNPFAAKNLVVISHSRYRNLSQINKTGKADEQSSSYS